MAVGRLDCIAIMRVSVAVTRSALRPASLSSKTGIRRSLHTFHAPLSTQEWLRARIPHVPLLTGVTCAPAVAALGLSLKWQLKSMTSPPSHRVGSAYTTGGTPGRRLAPRPVPLSPRSVVSSGAGRRGRIRSRHGDGKECSMADGRLGRDPAAMTTGYLLREGKSRAQSRKFIVTMQALEERE